MIRAYRYDDFESLDHLRIHQEENAGAAAR